MTIRLAFLALLSIWLALPVHADRTSDHYAKACGMTGTPSSVVVDVYNDASPGSILATIPNGQVSRFGTTDCYEVNLATTTAAIGYPDDDDPTAKHYTLRFRDDASNVVSLSETVHGLVGVDAYEMCARETPVYPTVSIPSRGITTQVIAQGKPSYFQIDVDCSGAFTSPPVTFYWIFHYDVAGRVSKRVPSSSPPSP